MKTPPQAVFEFMKCSRCGAEMRRIQFIGHIKKNHPELLVSRNSGLSNHISNCYLYQKRWGRACKANSQ